MDCGSLYSATNTEQERLGKMKCSDDWKVIARSARGKSDKPYTVHEISHEEIIDGMSLLDRHYQKM